MFKKLSKKPFSKEYSTSTLKTETPPESSTGRSQSFAPDQTTSGYVPGRENYLSQRMLSGNESQIPSPRHPRLHEYQSEEDSINDIENMNEEQWNEDFTRLPGTNEADTETPEMILGESVSFKGELSFQDFVCIHGYFEGQLVSEGKIVVGKKGTVKSNINLKEAIVEGHVEGDITADRVEVHGEAQVNGNITAKALGVDEGATIIGQVKVVPSDTEIKEQ